LKSKRSRNLLVHVLLTGIMTGVVYPASAAPGDLDTTFGTSGIVTTDFVSSSDDRAYGSAIQSDGKIIVVGSSGVNSAIARYNSDGSSDNSFDTDGKLSFDFGSTDEFQDVVVQSDGKIVVVGTSANNFLVARYNTNGSLDTSFDTDGSDTEDIGTGTTDAAKSVVLQSDGKIVVAGNSGNSFAIVRYNTDGSLDTSFDTDGKVTTLFSGVTAAESVVLQSDGKIVVAGVAATNFAVARYNLNGSLDNTFDTDGKVLTDIGVALGDYGASVTLQSDGKIVVAGTSANNFAVARYNTNGSLDTSFNTNGTITTDFGLTDEAYSVVVQNNGKILVGGVAYNGSNQDMAISRYNSNGTPDTTFGTDGKTVLNISGNDFLYSLQIQSGKILAVGRSSNQGSNFALARFSDASEPSAPTLNTVTAGDRRITVSFTAGSDNGAAITDYEYSLNGGSYISAGATTSPLIITGLNGRTTYSVTLKARNSVGLSSASGSLSATTIDAALDASEAAVAAKKAKDQRELIEILSLIPELGKLSLSLGDVALAVAGQKCLKNKAVRYVKKGAKCPQGFAKQK